MQVRFIKYGSSTAFGSFAPGDKLTCSESMARHLIEAKVAVAIEAPRPEPVPEAPKRKRKS